MFSSLHCLQSIYQMVENKLEELLCIVRFNSASLNLPTFEHIRLNSKYNFRVAIVG